MDHAELFQTVASLLSTNLTGDTLVYENEPFPSGGPFIFVEFWSDMLDQDSIGAGTRRANLWREEGVIAVHIMVERGVGTLYARQKAVAVSNIFRGEEISGVRFREIRIGAGEPSETDGNYARFSVSVAWEAYSSDD